MWPGRTWGTWHLERIQGKKQPLKLSFWGGFKKLFDTQKVNVCVGLCSFIIIQKHWPNQKWKNSCCVKPLARTSFPIFCQWDCVIHLPISAASLDTPPVRPWPQPNTELSERPQPDEVTSPPLDMNWLCYLLSPSWSGPVLSCPHWQHHTFLTKSLTTHTNSSLPHTWAVCVLPPAHVKSCDIDMQGIGSMYKKLLQAYVFDFIWKFFVV